MDGRRRAKRQLIPVRLPLGVVLALFIVAQSARAQTPDLFKTISDIQPKIVKLFGAGGLNRLEHYQTGFLISADGLVLTAWSYVLDTDSVTAVLNDGRRFEAGLVGFHPQLELAVLKINVADESFFTLDQLEPAIGTRILAVTNLYGVATGNEQASAQRGVIAAKSLLQAGHSSSATSYQGPVLVVDTITSNPGSAGGVITDLHGRLLGMIGKELVNRDTNLWFNFAIPTDQLSRGVQSIQARDGAQTTASTILPTESWTLDLLGIVLVPNVVSKTPPFVDQVISGSPAEEAGILPDDLVVEINGASVASRSAMLAALTRIDRDKLMLLTVQRKAQFLTVELTVK